MTSSTAIVPAPIVPFTWFIESFERKIAKLDIYAMQRILDFGRCGSACISMRVHPYDIGEAYSSPEACDELHAIESITDEYRYASEMARHLLRISATEDACLALAQARLDRLEFDLVVERMGLEEACRLQRRGRISRTAQLTLLNMDEPCQIQRMERRAEFIMDSRMSGTPIDWDAFSSI